VPFNILSFRQKFKLKLDLDEDLLNGYHFEERFI
jgi:hypothetical protein